VESVIEVDTKERRDQEYNKKSGITS